MPNLEKILISSILLFYILIYSLKNPQKVAFGNIRKGGNEYYTNIDKFKALMQPNESRRMIIKKSERDYLKVSDIPGCIPTIIKAKKGRNYMGNEDIEGATPHKIVNVVYIYIYIYI